MGRRASMLSIVLIIAVSVVLASAASPVQRLLISSTSLSVAEDGGILTAAGGIVKAFDVDFRPLWSYAAPSIVDAVSCGDAGQSYVASGALLVRIDDEGKAVWQAEANDRIYCILPLPGGAVAAGTGYGVQAFGASGEPIWEHYPQNQISPSTDCST